MEQIFNKITNTGSLIKNILAQSPIPNIGIVTEGDLILRNNTYICNNQLIFCTTSGTIGVDAEYAPLANYNFGTYYPQFTEKYKSKTAFYDSETHEKLGNYLRAYKKITGIDLMPFYNCFSESYIDRYILKGDHFLEKNAAGYKTVKIPIKFNQVYTIAVECEASLQIAAAFLNKNALLEVPNSGAGPKNLSQTLWDNSENFKTYCTTRFQYPFTFKVDNLDAENRSTLQKYEKFLHLVIQLPASNESSIVVLEGDYTNIKCYKQVDAEYLVRLSESTQNEIFLSNLSLLNMNDKQQHPFSNKLIEYLLRNVITSEEKIDNNVSYAQSLVPRGIFIFEDVKDVWTPELRYLVYQNSMKSIRSNKLDLNGFVDKDTEIYLQK